VKQEISNLQFSSMCGLPVCNQVYITIFSLIFVQSATIFGGCLFFGHIQIALLSYIVFINVATYIVFAADKQLARSVNQRAIPVFYFTDYDGMYREPTDQTALTTLQMAENMVTRRKSRVAEVVLYMLAFSGGIIGAWLGMVSCWHKIRKMTFVWKMTILTVFNVLGPLVWLCFNTHRVFKNVCIDY